jgi:hypothetical protein
MFYFRRYRRVQHETLSPRVSGLDNLEIAAVMHRSVESSVDCGTSDRMPFRQ